MGNIGKKISTNDREKQAYAFYLSKGWSPLQSAAIVGNLLHESGLNPSSEGDIGYKGGSSRGIAQFRGERLKRLKNQYGDNWNDFGNQLEFVNWELNNTHKSAGDALRKANDIYDAGRIVSDKYEIPAVKFKSNKDRQNKVFNTYNKLSGLTTDYDNYIPNPAGVSSNISTNAFELTEVPNFIPTNQVVNIDLDVPSEKKDTKEETQAKEDIARVTSEQQILEDYFSSGIQNQRVPVQPQVVTEVEQFPNLLDQYAQVSQFVDSPIAQQGGVTRQDSLNIYNSAIRFKQAINRLGYKPWDKEQDSHKDNNNLYIFKDGKIYLNKNIEDRQELKENTNTRKNGDVYLNSNVNRTGGKNTKPETIGYNHPVLKRVSPNQYETTEQTSFLGYNTELPTLLMDGRIVPHKKNQYNLKAGVRNHDFVVFNEYDPIAVKPFDLLTEAEKVERVKKYGKSGVPPSYDVNKPTSNSVTKMPTVEALDSLKQQGLIPFSSSSIGSDVNIPSQYIQPKYWEVEDRVNQNFGGYQQNYRIYPQTADYMLRELAPEPYNSRVSTPYYQSGGTIGNLTPSQASDIEKQREWINNWNSNRVIGGQKVNSNYQIPYSSDIYVDDLNYGNNGRETTLGEFDNVSDRLILDINYQSKPGIPAHELSHRYQKYLNPDIYNKYINTPISQALKQTQGSSEYHGNVDENQAELNRLRYNSGFKPEQVITPQDLQKYNPQDYNLKHFSTDQLINLLNSTAYNDYNNQVYAQQGGKIPVSSNGVYDFPMQEVIVPTKNGNITMKNVNYPIIGVDEYGNQILMMPGQEYKFPGKIIHEIPQLQQYFNKR